MVFVGKRALGKDSALLPRFVNRELLPSVHLLKRRHDERHGSVTDVSSDYTAQPADEQIRVDASAGAVMVSLPLAETVTMWRVVQKVDASANAVTVAATSLIRGAASTSTTTQWDWIMLLPVADTYDALV